MVEFINPQAHTVQLPSPDKKIIKIPAKTKIVLSEWYIKYCPKYLRVVRIINQGQTITPKNIQPAPRNTARTIKPNNRRKHINKATQHPKPARESKRIVRAQITEKNRVSKRKKDRLVVGRRSSEDSNVLYEKVVQQNNWTISNNVGIGILSYNRLHSLKRLINSIREYTVLHRTTVFVSDESTDPKVSEWLAAQTDLVVLTKQPRLGIAGNSNRLLKCLSRFKYGILLNDDVEILQKDWEHFYIKAHNATGYHHFSYYQLGVYGAKNRGKVAPARDQFRVATIDDKPHGAVMFYTNELFNKIGYFDEEFGVYGMEHVDWSERAGKCGLQPQGYHDIIGADKYFRIHQEKSAVVDRGQALRQSRDTYRKVSAPNRVYVPATSKSDVPSISVVIPIRDIGRSGAVKTVVNSIRSQKFPNIEIIVVEQDDQPKLNAKQLGPCNYFFARNKYATQPFTKAMAFNLGVANASHKDIVLQDADIVCAAHYVKKVYDLLKTHTGVHIGSKVLYLSESATLKAIKTAMIEKAAQCERVVTYFEGGSLACTKEAYFKCGAFNEAFEGYGIEDCDFFSRLKNFSDFCDVRSEDFIHMYHGRTPGWGGYHKKNKQIYAQIMKQHSQITYIKSLVSQLKTLYPTVAKDLGL